jgi:putative endopeptidase
MNARRASIRLLAIALCLALLTPAVGMAETAYTNGMAAPYLAESADAYREAPPTAEAVLAGVDAAVPLTHGTAARMILNAFGELPAPTGFRKLIGYWDTAFTDVPDDLLSAVTNLTQAGLWIPDDNALFLPDQPMEEAALRLLVDRIHAYLGSSLVDDFYTAVNQETLFGTEFFGEDTSYNNYRNNNSAAINMSAWFDETFAAAMAYEGNDNLPLANIREYITDYLDMEARQNGMAQLQPYMDALFNAATVQDFVDACATISRELGVEVLLTTTSLTNRQYVNLTGDRQTYLVFSQAGTGTSADWQPESYYTRATREQRVRLFQTLGFSDEQSNACMDFWLDLYLEDALANEADPNWNTLSAQMDTISNGLPFDLEAYVVDAGFPADVPWSVSSPGVLASRLKNLSEETLPYYAMDATRRLLVDLWWVVPGNVADKVMGLWNPTFEAYPEEYMTLPSFVESLTPFIKWDLAAHYAATHDVEAITAGVEELFDRYREAFGQILQEADWMDEATRLKALEKLDQMGIDILFDGDLAARCVPLTGETLLDHVATVKLAERDKQIAMARHEGWSDEATLVHSEIMWENAYYYPIANQVVMPLGFFITTDYDPAAPLNEQMLDLGFLMGHEVSHGFDDYGAQYDAQGNEVNWWTEASRAAFEARCQEVMDYYAAVEFAPGLYNIPEVTLGENIADMASMRLSMLLAANSPNFDYDAFFLGFADMMIVSTTRLGFQGYLEWDAHSAGRVRINPLMSLLEAFYETYGVEEGDAMYVAPEERVKVW